MCTINYCDIIFQGALWSRGRAACPNQRACRNSVYCTYMRPIGGVGGGDWRGDHNLIDITLSIIGITL